MGDLTLILERLNLGEQRAFDELVPLVYQELRSRAAFYLSGQNKGHTLQATALVHEVFLKMVGHDGSWTGSRHFYNAAAEVMRQILVSHARAKKAHKRGGLASRIDLEDVVLVSGDDSIDWELLDTALNELKSADPRRY